MITLIKRSHHFSGSSAEGADRLLRESLWCVRNPLYEFADMSACPLALIEQTVAHQNKITIAGHSAKSLAKNLCLEKSAQMLQPALFQSYSGLSSAEGFCHPLGLAEAIRPTDCLIMTNQYWANILVICEREIDWLALNISDSLIFPINLPSSYVEVSWPDSFDALETEAASKRCWRWCISPSGESSITLTLHGSKAMDVTCDMTLVSAAQDENTLEYSFSTHTETIAVGRWLDHRFTLRLQPGENSINLHWPAGGLAPSEVGQRHLCFAIQNLIVSANGLTLSDATASMTGALAPLARPVDDLFLRTLLHGAGFAEVVFYESSDHGDIASMTPSHVGLDERFLHNPLSPEVPPTISRTTDRLTWVLARRKPLIRGWIPQADSQMP